MMNKASNTPVCLGTGLIALDVIYSKKKNPNFLAGGSCGNVLTILSYLGWKSFPIARLGNDVEGNRIIEDMKNWGVNDKFIEQEDGIKSPRIIEKLLNGKKATHRFYLKCIHGNWLPHRKPYLLKSLGAIQDKIPSSNVFYFDRASPSALELATNLKKEGVIIFFEPPKFLQDENFLDCLKIADIVKHCYDQSEETERSGIKIPLEIQTMGEKGLRYRTQLNQKSWNRIEAFPVYNLVDTAGSGDWLTAGLIHVLFHTKSKYFPSQKKLEFALKFGEALAALNCNFIGARGIMYNLPKSQLLSLVNKIMKNQQKPIAIKNTRDIKTSSRFASKCKVCLCTN